MLYLYHSAIKERGEWYKKDKSFKKIFKFPRNITQVESLFYLSELLRTKSARERTLKRKTFKD